MKRFPVSSSALRATDAPACSTEMCSTENNPFNCRGEGWAVGIEDVAGITGNKESGDKLELDTKVEIVVVVVGWESPRVFLPHCIVKYRPLIRRLRPDTNDWQRCEAAKISRERKNEEKKKVEVNDVQGNQRSRNETGQCRLQVLSCDGGSIRWQSSETDRFP